MTSIIIPAYNVEPYLRRCIRSIIEQSRTDWECIIVNDGSTDGTLKLAAELTYNDSRFTIVNQDNCGIGAARNAGINIATGDNLLFVDADDWIEYDALDHLEVVARYHPEAGRICGQQLVHHKGACWHWGLPRAGFLSAEDPVAFADSENDLGHATGCLYVRDRIPCEFQFPEVKIFEDMLFNMELLMAGVNTYISPKVVYHYEVRSDSILSCNYSQEDAAKTNDVFVGLLKRHNPGDDMADRFRRFLGRAIKGKLNTDHNGRR